MKTSLRCVAVVSVLLPVCCFPEAFTIEQVLSAPFPSGLTSAAHAPRVAWIFDNKGERNIWVADAPDFVPRQVTHYTGDEGQQIASVRLSPDGKTIVYARGTELNKEETSANPLGLAKLPKQQAWAVTLAAVSHACSVTLVAVKRVAKIFRFRPTRKRWSGRRRNTFGSHLSMAKKRRSSSRSCSARATRRAGHRTESGSRFGRIVRTIRLSP